MPSPVGKEFVPCVCAFALQKNSDMDNSSKMIVFMLRIFLYVK